MRFPVLFQRLNLLPPSFRSQTAMGLDLTLESGVILGHWTWDIAAGTPLYHLRRLTPRSHLADKGPCGICHGIFDLPCPQCTLPGASCPIGLTSPDRFRQLPGTNLTPCSSTIALRPRIPLPLHQRLALGWLYPLPPLPGALARRGARLSPRGRKPFRRDGRMKLNSLQQ
jgi:hypothetical protein